MTSRKFLSLLGDFYVGSSALMKPPEAGGGSKAGGEDTPGPAARFDTSDRLVILLLAIASLAAVAGFFFFVHRQSLIGFPETRIPVQIAEGNFEYFAFALEYRERRLALALTYRTFITTFGFTVGLVLAAIGGFFILRQATVQFEAQSGKPDASPLTASIKTSSPGVLFMLGGVAVMVVTQYLAIPVGAPEIFPSNSRAVCDRELEARGACTVGGRSSPSLDQAEMIKSMCGSNDATEPEWAWCEGFENALRIINEPRNSP